MVCCLVNNITAYNLNLLPIFIPHHGGFPIFLPTAQVLSSSSSENHLMVPPNSSKSETYQSHIVIYAFQWHAFLAHHKIKKISSYSNKFSKVLEPVNLYIPFLFKILNIYQRNSDKIPLHLPRLSRIQFKRL